MVEQLVVVPIDGDTIGKIKRLRSSLREAGVELPPKIGTRALVRRYGEELMKLAYAYADRPATPISELEALGVMLESHGVEDALRRKVRRQYRSLYHGSNQRNIYSNIIA